MRSNLFDEHVFVWVDGSCISNGRAGAQAGWGIWWENPDLRRLNDAGRLAGDLQTNNRAELTAMIKAVQACPKDGRTLHIRSDSRYSIQSMKWIAKWRTNGWRTVLGRPVKNRDLIEELDEELSQFRTRPILRFIPAHRGHPGNEKADGMAKYGARLQRPDWC